jgi:hypothetical protein
MATSTKRMGSKVHPLHIVDLCTIEEAECSVENGHVQMKHLEHIEQGEDYNRNETTKSKSV